MKKIITVLSILFFSASLFAFDVSFHLNTAYEIPVDSFYGKAGGISFNLGADISPVVLRERDKLFVTGQFAFTNYFVEDFKNQIFLDGGFGIGYDFRLNDRISITPDFYSGVWKYLGGGAFNVQSSSGIVFAGKLAAEMHIGPAFAVNAFAGFKCFYSNPDPFLNSVQLGIGLKYSFTKGLFSTNMIQMEAESLEPLFPVFYTHYDSNNFGKITLINNEDNSISDVSVTVYIDSYMSNPKTVITIPYIEMGETFEVDLYALLNENILNLVQPKTTDMEITITYYSIGKQRVSSYEVPVIALNRNSMTWEDDRRAAAFVSGKDATAQRFAKQVQGIVKPLLSSSVPKNIQYAAAMFGALKAFGINYVVDPSSAFTDNVGTASVDFLQFPYQTLLYHGGDCDDLTILNCSLLEAIGIETAFITVPGHIYMAFDSGLSLAEGKAKVEKGYYIEAYDKIWVPVEITLSQDTFGLAWTYGAREWKKAGEEALLIPLSYAWDSYLPISVPGSETAIDLPEKEEIINLFKSANYY